MLINIIQTVLLFLPCQYSQDLNMDFFYNKTIFGKNEPYLAKYEGIFYDI